MGLPLKYSIDKKINGMEGFSAYENGGKGSGNFHHAGRPGERGGSAPSGSGGASGSSATKTKKYTKSDLINDEYKEGYITAGERDMLLKKAQEDGSATESAEPFKDKKSASGKAHSNKKSQESATEWAKKNFTSGEQITDKDMSFDEVLARMVDGEDYYSFMGSDSVDREAMFSEMAKRTGLEYEDIYQAWMGDMGGQSRRYTDELIKSPRQRELDRLNESGFQHWQKTGKQDLLLGTKEHDERNLRDMVRSTWTYGGGKDSKYLHDGYRSLSDKERKKIIDDEWKYLDDNCTTAYAGEDSEGVSYRGIKYRPSSKKKNNSLENVIANAIIEAYNGGKGSGNFGHAGREGKVGGSAPSGSGGNYSVKESREATERAFRELGHTDPAKLSKEEWAEVYKKTEDILAGKDKGDDSKSKGGDGEKYGKYSRSKTYTQTGEIKRHSDGSITTDSDYEPETYRDIAKAQGVTQTVSQESYIGKFDGIDGVAKDVGGAQATLALKLESLGEKLLDAGNTKGKYLEKQLKDIDDSLATTEKLFADYSKATAKGQRHDIGNLVGGTSAQIKAIQARDKALKEVLKTFQDATKKAHELKPNETGEAYYKDIDISDVWKD